MDPFFATPSADATAQTLRSIPHILQLRQDGRIYDFPGKVLNGGGNQQQWILSSRRQIRPGSRSKTTALDLSTGNSQFLLTGSQTGNISIYDLWENPEQHQTTNMSISYQPIQQASAGLSTVPAVQWYPVDTGIFLTASAAGTVCLWDTAAMVPVLQTKPFQFTEESSSYALRCMHVSPHNLLAATGSNGSAIVKLVDLKSGAASHSLIPPGKSTSGVTAVRWSPVNANILASCAGIALLWDIRKSTRPLAILEADYRPTESSVSNAYCTDGSHWRPNKKAYRVIESKPATRTSATNLAFDENGQHLVTICGKRQVISVWDLRYSDAPVRRMQTFVDVTGGPPVDRGSLQPLMLTGQFCRERLIWVAKGNNLQAYSMLGAFDGKPVVTLRGHLGQVQAAAVTTAPVQMISAASDGLILVWERHRPERPGNQRRKRRAQDVDSW